MRSVTCLLLVAACGHAGAPATPTTPTAPAAPPAAAAAPAAARPPEVLPLADGVWLHHTYSDDDIEANGLVVATARGAILVDTGWRDADADALFAWGAAHGHPITDVIITHFHADRAGGLASALRHGARVHTGAATAARLADAARAAAPAARLDALASPATLDLDGARVEVFFPGAGHTPDNTVVYLPATRILDGGCFLKSAAAEDLGNLGDADLAAWPASLAAVAARYPDATIAIPGHGAIDGTAAIARTRALLAAKAAADHAAARDAVDAEAR